MTFHRLREAPIECDWCHSKKITYLAKVTDGIDWVRCDECSHEFYGYKDNDSSGVARAALAKLSEDK